MITFSSINFETEISTFRGFTNFTDERLLPDREFARSEDHWPTVAGGGRTSEIDPERPVAGVRGNCHGPLDLPADFRTS